MSYLLEILGRGLLADLGAAFRPLLDDDNSIPTAVLQGMAEDAPDDPEAQFHYGVRCLTKENPVDARKSFARCLALDPKNLAAHTGLACALDELGNIDACILELENITRDHTEYSPALFALGYMLEKADRLEDAAATYEVVIEEAPTLRNAHERLAAIALKQQNYDEAIECYEHLCYCEPGDVALSLVLGNLYFQTGMYADAAKRFQYALTIEPDNWDAKNDLISVLEESGQYVEAIEELERIMLDGPIFADQYLRLGDLYTKMGAHAIAMEKYLDAVKVNPEYLEATIKVGTAHLRSSEYEEAARWFSRATEINDRILVGYAGLAAAQFECGDTQEAETTLNLASGIEPNSTLLFSEMARLQLKVSAGQQAKKYLAPSAIAEKAPPHQASPTGDLIERQIERHRAAIRKRPNHADLHYRLGLLLRQREQKQEAIQCYRKALSINPNYVKALIKLGLSLAEEGQFDEAVSTIERAIRLDPHTSDLHYQLGLIFADRNQFSLAVEQFEHSLGDKSNSIDMQANLALALQNMGLIDRAASAWQTLCDMLPESEEGQAIIKSAYDHMPHEQD